MRARSVSRRTLLRRGWRGGVALAVAGAGSLDAGAVGGGGMQAAAAGRVRRVVVGHDGQGRSCVVSDDLVNGSNLWETSRSMPLGAAVRQEPLDVRPPTRTDVDPPAGGTRWMTIAMPPSASPRPSLENRRGFHRTGTVDYVFLTGGAIVLLLDAEEVRLKAGDALVLRNAMHAWRNDGDAPATFVITSVSVDRGR